jgi:hypothetical protein
MNKIAAYQVALAEIEQEKRASALVEAYGTMDGFMPEGYLQAFDEMEKEAVISSIGQGLAAIGRGVTGAVRGAGKAVAKGAAEGSARSTLGGAMQRGAKGVFDAGGDAQALLGGAVLGTGLAAGGAGLMAGRYVVPEQRQ